MFTLVEDVLYHYVQHQIQAKKEEKKNQLKFDFLNK